MTPLNTRLLSRRTLFRAGGVAIAYLACLAGMLEAADQGGPNKTKSGPADAFFAKNGVVVLKIELAESAVDSLRKTPREYVPARVREGDSVYEDVVLHLKGGAGSFRKFDDKPGLTLKFRKAYSFHGLKKLHLSNSVQDPTYISQIFGADMFLAAGVPAARATHALVEINGRKLGLYVLLEGMDTTFLGRHFKDPSGNLYGETHPRDIHDPIERMLGKGPLTRDDLKGLAAACGETDAVRRLERLRQHLDVDRFLSFMALEIMLCHQDGYAFNCHNFRVYQDVDTHRMVFFPHDLDQLVHYSTPPRPVVPENYSGRVSGAVLRTPELRALYLERFRQLYAKQFVDPELTAKVQRIVERTLPGLRAYDPTLAKDFEKNASSFRDRLVKRSREVERMLNPPEDNPKKK